MGGGSRVAPPEALGVQGFLRLRMGFIYTHFVEIEIWLVESQKGVISIQPFSVENPEGPYRHRLCTVIAPF